MVVRHRREAMITSGNQCRRCGRSYWEQLPACPYCGSTNRGSASNDLEGMTTKKVDPRNAMKLISNNFYYIFLGLSIICALLVIIHDIPENVSSQFSESFQSLQTNTRVLFWILYIIQQIMFCYWLMTEYNALSSLRINKRFNGALAWTTFIPLANLYFPQAMVQELEDRLYYLQVPRINIRFVPIWWFFQCIAYLYMLGLSCGLLNFLDDPGLFWLVVIIELCWAVAIFCQGYLLYGFMSSVNTVGNSRRRSYNHRESDTSASSRRVRHRR